MKITRDKTAAAAAAASFEKKCHSNSRPSKPIPTAIPTAAERNARTRRGNFDLIELSRPHNFCVSSVLRRNTHSFPFFRRGKRKRKRNNQQTDTILRACENSYVFPIVKLGIMDSSCCFFAVERHRYLGTYRASTVYITYQLVKIFQSRRNE